MRHMIIPDTQVTDGVNTDHLDWAGQYAVKVKPDVIVMIGDWFDMSSLSTYEGKGSKHMEGQRYNKDIAAGNAGMDRFMKPIQDEQERQRKSKHKIWKPRLVFTMGNHEARIERAINADPKLDGLIGYKDMNLEQHGWEVYPYLEPVVIDGVAYAHYFTSGVMGRPVSSARAMLTKKHMSCCMGHVQQRDIAYSRRADGTSLTGIFAGIFYTHDEHYLNAQTNEAWRGLWVLHEVEDGSFDEMPVSMNYLEKRYGQPYLIAVA